MDYPLHHDDTIARPWRTAMFVAVGVAAVELLLLIVVGGALLAKPDHGPNRTAAARKATTPANATKAKATAGKASAGKAAPAAAELPRRRVSVLVLNGNGRQGAAAAAASRVSRRGYRIGGVANAPSTDFTRSLVMYRRGFEGEGRRLARDLGIRIVGPLDGIRPGQLQGAQAVVVVGA